MRTVFGFTGGLFLAAGILAAQPTINTDGIVNNASYIPAGLPSSGIAQGSIFVVFGSNMGPAALAQATSFPLPTVLGETSIQITPVAGGATVNAIMLYTSAGQVGAVLPSNTPVGDANVTVTYRGQRSAPAKVTVVKSAFGIFAINQAGSGPGVVTDTNYVVNVVTGSFTSGQVGMIWGTGGGPVPGDEAAGGLGPKEVDVAVEIFVGGKPAKVIYKGRSGCCAGLDQFVFETPAGVEGCYVPVWVRANGVVSNFVTMSISSTGKVCSDATGLSGADLQKILSGGNLSLGSVVLSRTGLRITAPPPINAINSTTDDGGGTFFRYDFNRLIASNGVAGYPTIGSCTVFTFRGMAPGASPVKPDPLDAGQVLTVKGPNGTKQLPRTSPGLYSAELGSSGLPGQTGQLYLDKGAYTVDNGSGGRDVGAFTATINVPDPLNWTNQDSINNISKSRDLPITWSGGDPSGFVTITGFSIVQAPAVGAGFICTERTSAGQFAVPSAVLQTLPISGQISGVPSGLLSVGSLTSAGRFTATGLDAGFTYSSVSSSKNVNFVQ